LCDELKGTVAQNEQLTKDNDSLLYMNDSLHTRITDMHGEYASLEKKHTELNASFQDLTKEQIELQKKYSNLFTDNFTQAHLFNQRMKDKEDMLKEKEANLILREQELEAIKELLTNKEKGLKEREQKIKELEQVIARQDSIAKRLNNILREALLGFKSDELNIEIKDGKVYVSMSDKLMFKSGSANVESKGKEAIALISKVIAENPNFDVLIEGHTDNVPISTNRFSDNWDLSVARATAMVRILINEHKIPPVRVTASGKGEYSPKATNETAEGRAQNRRTEIILSPKLNELMDLINE
jgi:chemotaxis protein MotB